MECAQNRNVYMVGPYLDQELLQWVKTMLYYSNSQQ